MLEAFRKRAWAWLIPPREQPDEIKILADICILNLPGSIARVPSGWKIEEYLRFLVAEQNARKLYSGDRLDDAEDALSELREAIRKRAGIHLSDCARHHGPAMMPGPCDCGADPGMTPELYGSEFPITMPRRAD